jgi:hypothetical protein
LPVGKLQSAKSKAMDYVSGIDSQEVFKENSVNTLFSKIYFLEKFLVEEVTLALALV